MTPPLGLPDPAFKPEFYEGVAFKRFLAWLVDIAAVLALTIVICLLTFGIGFFFFALVLAITGVVYRWWTIAGASATWGMRLMAIELRDTEGARLGSGTALAHTMGTTLSFVFPVAQLASAVMMLTTGRGQGLTDMVLGTAMINRPAPGWR